MNENRFASGWKRSYYGKGDVTVYRLNRAEGSVFAANVMLLIYGDAFWPTYTTGDNTGLVATDSMKNFIQRETLNFAGSSLEEYCRFLGEKFLATYPHAEGVQIAAVEIPYSAAGVKAFAPSGPERAFARLEICGNEGGGSALGNRRLPPAATGRQRVSGIYPRSIHHTSGVERPAAAYVARSGMELCEY